MQRKPCACRVWYNISNGTTFHQIRDFIILLLFFLAISLVCTFRFRFIHNFVVWDVKRFESFFFRVNVKKEQTELHSSWWLCVDYSGRKINIKKMLWKHFSIGVGCNDLWGSLLESFSSFCLYAFLVRCSWWCTLTHSFGVSN